MIGKSIAAGLAGLRRRPGLVGLIYGINLIVAFVLAIPVYIALNGVVGPTGFGSDLAGAFDIVLWADILEKMGPVFSALQMQLLWMIPLYVIWKSALAVGLIHAMRGDQVRSFWQGVGRYTGKAVLLALLFLVMVVVWLLLTFLVALGLGSFWGGEVGSFWINLVIAPTVLISGLAVLDLMHDYARIALVVDEQKVSKAVGIGIGWPFRHGRASWLYVFWFALAALLLAATTFFDMNVAAATGAGIWGLFLLQQAILLLRAAVTVGWFGSETAFYETIRLREMPLIAAEEVEAPAASEEIVGSQQGGVALA